MYSNRTIFEFEAVLFIILLFIGAVKNKRGSLRLPRCLLLPELKGFTVGAFCHCGILFVGTYQNTDQGTVVFSAAVICALQDGTLNTVIGFAVHNNRSFHIRLHPQYKEKTQKKTWNYLPNIEI